MSFEFLLPLGLLGLLGILALIIIYIIRPNYLVYHIPSTYVWKLSLRYKKRRLPTSRLRNILLFICQILILTSIAGILAQPALVEKNASNQSDVIAIIDSSASMYAETNDETRFKRAVDYVIDLATDTFSKGGMVSVIVADGEPAYLSRRVTSEASAQLLSELKTLRDNEQACYYGTSDITAAMKLTEEVLDENPSADIYLYTDEVYDETYAEQLEEHRNIHIKNVNDASEWNGAVLGASAEIVDTYCELTVEIASYNMTRELDLYVEISGPDITELNPDKQPIVIVKPVFCEKDTVKKIVFRYGGGGDETDVLYHELGVEERFQTFRSINISLRTGGDSLSADDSFNLYGGRLPVLKVQYASSRNIPANGSDKDNPGPNPFVNGALGMVKNAFSRLQRYDVQITEVQQGKEPALTGFDFYVFEHDMPDVLPSDGVVFLLDPNVGWAGAGLSVISINDFNKTLTSCMANVDNENHFVMNDPNGFKLVPDRIGVSSYKVLTCDPSYDILMTCDSDPVLAVRKDEKNQVAVLSFSVHNSSLPREIEMGALFFNLFDYYFPGIVSDFSAEVGGSVEVNSRGQSLSATGPAEFSKEITEFPDEVSFDLPGTYTFTGITWYEQTLTAQVFVKMPAAESDIFKSRETLAEPEKKLAEGDITTNLIIYLAAALVALAFAEWWLHTREGR